MRKYLYPGAILVLFLLWTATATAQKNVLIAVDIDQSTGYWDPGTTYAAALTNLGYNVIDTIYAPQNGEIPFPSPFTANEYDCAVILTSENWWASPQNFQSEDETALQAYQDTGGNVLVVGQDLLLGYKPSWGAASGWFKNYMGLDSVSQDTLSNYASAALVGAPGTFADGLDFSIYGGASSTGPFISNDLYIDHLTPIPGAFVAWTAEGTADCAIGYNGGTFRSFFSTAEFGAAGSQTEFETALDAIMRFLLPESPCHIPRTPVDPDPAHEAIGVPLDVLLSWRIPDPYLYAIDSQLDQLFTLNQTNGEATLIGSTAPAMEIPAGLAFDGINMFAIDFTGGGLYTLDLDDGAPTYMGTTGIGGWQGLAADPTDNGQLYGITQSSDNNTLYLISSDGTLTLISTNVGNLITALEFDSNGVLWGVEFSSGEIYTIGKDSGALTHITTTIAGFQGVAFDKNGVLWGQNTDTDALYTIDLSTGVATLIGANSLPFVKGLDFDFPAGAPILPPTTGNPVLPRATKSQTPSTYEDALIDLTTQVEVYINPDLIYIRGAKAVNFSTEIPEGYSILNGVLVEGEFAIEPSIPAPSFKSSNLSSIVGETVINFDDIPSPCFFIDTARLTDEYKALGVIFEGPGGNDGGAILDECGGFSVSGHSSPNFLAFNSFSTLSDGGKPQGPETLRFNPPVSSVQALVGSNFGIGLTVTMEAYNSMDVMVDSDYILLAPVLAPISVSGDFITKVVISSDANVFVLDDLTFFDSCVPVFDVYLGTDDPPTSPVCQNIPDTFCNPGELLPSTTYYWRVVAKNDAGETPGPVWRFTTSDYFWLQADPADPDTGEITLEDLLTPATGLRQEGTTVTLYAVPACGYKFDHWSGGLSGSENPASLFMDSEKNVLAHFTPCSIIVPDDFFTIQEAIDSVEPFDACEIIVHPGIYYENINFGGKSVILRSTDPYDPVIVAATIIDGDFSGSVVTFDGAEKECATLAGFTIRNGLSNIGAGVRGNGTLATIHHNVITSNTIGTLITFNLAGVVIDGFGGGVAGCNGFIYNNFILANSAYLGGGLANCNGTIANCVIAFNSANVGGGLWNCDQNLWNNAIYGNSANVSGGGLSNCSGETRNCVIWGNAAPNYPQIDLSVNPRFSCVQDWAGGGTGNITDDPQLVDPQNGDFHLKPVSPCIDAGTSISLEFDFEGDPRTFRAIYWDTRGDGSFTDIGPDEYIGIVPFGDPPQLTILTPSGEMELTTDTFRIRWIDSDADDNAMIFLYYDTDSAGEDGIMIQDYISEDSPVDHFDFDISLMPEGIYWIYGVIDDGHNFPVVSYSPGSFMVSRITIDHLKNHLLGAQLIPVERFLFADYNRDGYIDIADLVFLLNWR